MLNSTSKEKVGRFAVVSTLVLRKSYFIYVIQKHNVYSAHLLLINSLVFFITDPLSTKHYSMGSSFSYTSTVFSLHILTVGL